MIGNKRIGIYPDGPMKWFDRVSGTFRTVYQLTPQLPDQAAEYAYMSLGLTAQAPLGRGVHAGSFRTFGAAPSMAMQAPKAAGLPAHAGSWTQTPLSGEIV